MGERPQVILRMGGDLKRRLTDAADRHGVSMNWLACQLLREGVDDLLPPEEVALTRSRRTALAAAAVAEGDDDG